MEQKNPADGLKARQISWETIDIDDGQLTLCGTLTNATLETTPVWICAGLELATPQVLQLYPLQIQFSADRPPLKLDGFQIDLGSDVDIQELTLTRGQLMCRGRLSVIP